MRIDPNGVADGGKKLGPTGTGREKWRECIPTKVLLTNRRNGPIIYQTFKVQEIVSPS